MAESPPLTGTAIWRPTDGAIGGHLASSPDITTRRATAADVSVLGRFGALLVGLHHSFDPDRFIAAKPETERAYGSFLGSELSRPGVVILVAEERGVILGYTYAGL